MCRGTSTLRALAEGRKRQQGHSRFVGSVRYKSKQGRTVAQEPEKGGRAGLKAASGCCWRRICFWTWWQGLVRRSSKYLAWDACKKQRARLICGVTECNESKRRADLLVRSANVSILIERRENLCVEGVWKSKNMSRFRFGTGDGEKCKNEFQKDEESSFMEVK